MPSAAEAEDRGGEEQRLKDDEEAAELDDALDDSFPASDPPAQTIERQGKVVDVTREGAALQPLRTAPVARLDLRDDTARQVFDLRVGERPSRTAGGRR